MNTTAVGFSPSWIKCRRKGIKYRLTKWVFTVKEMESVAYFPDHCLSAGFKYDQTKMPWSSFIGTTDCKKGLAMDSSSSLFLIDYQLRVFIMLRPLSGKVPMAGERTVFFYKTFALLTVLRIIHHFP